MSPNWSDCAIRVSQQQIVDESIRARLSTDSNQQTPNDRIDNDLLLIERRKQANLPCTKVCAANFPLGRRTRRKWKDFTRKRRFGKVQLQPNIRDVESFQVRACRVIRIDRN